MVPGTSCTSLFIHIYSFRKEACGRHIPVLRTFWNGMLGHECLKGVLKYGNLGCMWSPLFLLLFSLWHVERAKWSEAHETSLDGESRLVAASGLRFWAQWALISLATTGPGRKLALALLHGPPFKVSLRALAPESILYTQQMHLPNSLVHLRKLGVLDSLWRRMPVHLD